MSDAVTVQFTRDEWLPVTRDGSDYQVHYSFVPSDLVGQPEEATETKSGTIVVGISGSLSAVWNLRGEDLRKVLFEYAKRRVKAKAEEDSLGGRAEIQLTTASAPGICPFDPARVKLQFDRPFRFEMPTRNHVAAAAPASLPSEIIDLRDSINAIFGEQYGGRLLTLPQERHIVELFKECTGHEDFTYRVASIGGLATAISPDDLKPHLTRNPPGEKRTARTTRKSKTQRFHDQKPLDLLGAFLRARYPINQASPIMDALKNFNNLRRMYRRCPGDR